MAGGVEHNPETPLLAATFSGSSDTNVIGKKGTIWTAVAHIITGVIGAGVLSLAWSIAQLGWIAGPLAILFCAAVTLFATTILSDCYKSPDSQLGPTTNCSLLEAARFYFGKKWTWLCGLLQYVSFYGTGIAYVITSATSMSEIQRSNCYHKGGEKAHCQTGTNIFMLIFGIIQIVTSQIPNFHNMAWLSVVAALMSFCYSFIGLGLGFSKVIDNKAIKGSIVGIPTRSAAQKIWLVFQALGDIAFAYPYSIILLEIQAAGAMNTFGNEEVDSQIPFLDSSYGSSSSSSSLALKRTGNEWTALAHIITSVIGSGVLSLAWSMAQLGWIAGPLTMLLFACVSLTSALLLCNCYKSPDPENGPDRNGCYVDAVQNILEQYRDQTAIMIKNMKWLSIVAAVMSFAYSIIGSALGLAKVIENGEIKGSTTGLPSSTAAEKVWLVGQALGDIAFASSFSLVFLEVQDTLKAPPSEKITMKKVSIMTSCVTTFFYLCCGGFGYAAFGNSTPGNLLTGFGFYEPYWLVDFANACVVLHLVGAYQIFSQPLFADIEIWFARKFPDSKFVHKNYTLKPLLMLPFRLNFMRLFFRTAYVALITGISVLFPYFNQVVGVSGAISFWPIIVYFPVEMYLSQKKAGNWKSKAIALRVYTIVCLVVMLYAFVGSIRGVIVARLR